VVDPELPDEFALEDRNDREISVRHRASGHLYLLVRAHAGLTSKPRKRALMILSKHCSSPAYLECLAADGAMRRDVNGVLVEPVSERDRQYACERLAARKESKGRAKLTARCGGVSVNTRRLEKRASSRLSSGNRDASCAARFFE